MASIYSVNSLAQTYADRRLEGQQLEPNVRALEVKRHIWNFKVTGVHVFTAATVVAVATAFFTSSLFIAFAAFVVYQVRKAFIQAVDLTGVQNQRGHDMLELERRNELAQFLHIQDAKWQPVRFQFLNFRGWMDYAPTADAPAEVPVAAAAAIAPAAADLAHADADPVAAADAGLAHADAGPVDDDADGVNLNGHFVNVPNAQEHL